jgi:hypothetical protein
MKKLRPLRKQNSAEQSAYSRGSLASRALKVRGIERSGIRDGAVMLGVRSEHVD